MVIDGLAISEIIEPRGSPSLAGEFASMPHSGAWTGSQPYLVAAAAALSAGRHANLPPPRWTPPTASLSVVPPIRRPRAGWPPR